MQHNHTNQGDHDEKSYRQPFVIERLVHDDTTTICGSTSAGVHRECLTQANLIINNKKTTLTRPIQCARVESLATLKTCSNLVLNLVLRLDSFAFSRFNFFFAAVTRLPSLVVLHTRHTATTTASRSFSAGAPFSRMNRSLTYWTYNQW
jgi:hypothetical protein